MTSQATTGAVTFVRSRATEAVLGGLVSFQAPYQASLENPTTAGHAGQPFTGTVAPMSAPRIAPTFVKKSTDLPVALGVASWSPPV